MNAAAVLALCASVLQLGMGLLLLGLARAPGWRGVRIFALIALTASAYSAANLFFALPDFSDRAVLAASRFNYFAGSVHCAAWLVYTFGGPRASWRQLNTPLKSLAFTLGAFGTFILLTGSHYVPGEWANTTIAWAKVSYRSPALHPWAEWYGALMVGSLLVPFAEFARRARAGEPGAITHLLGFCVFFACAVVELLVANEVINTFYMADVGFLAVVLPVAIATVRRVVADAGRLDELSKQLTVEVEARTKQLDRAQVALLESERHAALGRLAAGVGHEINNPLTYLGLSLDTIDTWAEHAPLPSDVRDALVHARDGSHRIRLVVDSLRDYTRSSTGETRLLNPSALVQTALRVAAHQVHHVARIETAYEETAPIRGDEARLVQVVVNLLTNAAQAMVGLPPEREALITVRTREIGETYIAIEIADTGTGIAPEHLRLLTQPYFTTRAESGGTGLGLYLARGIVEQHGGRLEMASAIGVGTTASILLPRVLGARADVVVEVATEHALPRDGKRPQVLIVDDEPILARGLARALSPYCDVEVANSGHEAMARVARESEPIDAVVCDVMMPGMSGIEFAAILADTNPRLRERTLFMTGGAVTAAASAFLDRSDVRFVNKPIGASELADEISKLLVES